MTDNDKPAVLKAWVEKGIEGGWNIDNREEYLTTWYVDGNGIVFHFEDEDKKYMKWFSLPDLIASADFMHSVYGLQPVCFISGESENCKYMVEDKKKNKSFLRCGHYTLPKYVELAKEVLPRCPRMVRFISIYQYHQQQLVILDDDERLEYIKRTMG